MVFKAKNKIVIHCEVVDNDEWKEELTFDDYNKDKMLIELMRDNTIQLGKIEDMTFNLTIIIKELYDMNGVEVPIAKWVNHNVQTNI